MGTVKLEIEDNIAIVSFSNPPKGFLDSNMVAQTNNILDAIVTNDEVKAVIFTGQDEGVFIRHFSVEELIASSAGLKAKRAKGGLAPRHSEAAGRLMWETIDNFPKPTLAAINGYCGGGGCELALACDIRLAGPGDYTIGQMEILVGILPGAGGTVRLARLVGPGKALEWVLRGRTFYPEEAYANGLVNHYIEGDVLEAAKQMASEFVDKPAAALAAIKQVIRASWGKTTREGINEEGDLFATLVETDPQALKLMQDYVADDHPLKKI
ncbi:enoyl-CoA hydratase/isomerase family protein [Alphaproteobacteria bacterium]|nr:enoyl-CoA hydratase/isomerase family protein [Alphaproteobacteria bacterium]